MPRLWIRLVPQMRRVEPARVEKLHNVHGRAPTWMIDSRLMTSIPVLVLMNGYSTSISAVALYITLGATRRAWVLPVIEIALLHDLVVFFKICDLLNEAVSFLMALGLKVVADNQRPQSFAMQVDRLVHVFDRD